MFNIVTYVHNRAPTRALGGCTLFEVGYGAKPALRTCAFGTQRAVVQPLEDLRKLDAWSRICFLLATSIREAGLGPTQGGRSLSSPEMPFSICNTWNQRSHSRLHVFAVGTQFTFVKQPNLNIDETRKTCLGSFLPLVLHHHSIRPRPQEQGLKSKTSGARPQEQVLAATGSASKVHCQRKRKWPQGR